MASWRRCSPCWRCLFSCRRWQVNPAVEVALGAEDVDVAGSRQPALSAGSAAGRGLRSRPARYRVVARQRALSWVTWRIGVARAVKRKAGSACGRRTRRTIRTPRRSGSGSARLLRCHVHASRKSRTPARRAGAGGGCARTLEAHELGVVGRGNRSRYGNAALTAIDRTRTSPLGP